MFANYWVFRDGKFLGRFDSNYVTDIEKMRIDDLVYFRDNSGRPEWALLHTIKKDRRIDWRFGNIHIPNECKTYILIHE